MRADHLFPVGASIELADFDRDPYPHYRRLLDSEPVSWVPALSMFTVAPYSLCRDILRDDQTFVVGFERSTVFDILGSHMMSVEGDEAKRLKRAHQAPFLPGAIRAGLEPGIVATARELIGAFRSDGEVELRSAFAARLPVLVMLDLFGLPRSDEDRLRSWYLRLERAVANDAWDEDVRMEGKHAAAAFHDHIRSEVRRVADDPRPGTMLDDLVNGPESDLEVDEIALNAGIILFGGITTVEALILDAVWALGRHPDQLERVRRDPALAGKAISETIRWLGPVQSAHRLVTRDTEIGGHRVSEGSTLSCLLAAANRDGAVFDHPDRFDIGRSNAHQHLGFAAGQHFCLGVHLAGAEGRIALTELIDALPGLHLDPSRPSEPEGSEFRQPRSLWIRWGSA